ncbi:MAG: patatin-like phospholipase family protein [Candidatus Rokubacteria bacterium]|nr:patatin-like phospholipase family protein [Candidatus Rokubacteria bacterium]
MTALILCGGGSRGAVEVGLYRALVELGIRFDLIVGASVGAINGAAIAGGMSPGDLAAMWRALRARDVFRVNRRLLTRLLWADSLYDHRPLRRFLEPRLPARTFAALKTPLIVTATNFETGEPVTLRQGDLIEAIMASVALPGLFPPQRIGGVQVVDGGLTANVPIEVAVAHGADRVIFTLCGCCERLTGTARGLFGIFARALSIAIDRKYLADLEHFGPRLTVVKIGPPIANVPLLDFSHTADLIEAGYVHALAGLKEARARETSWT